MKIAVGISGGVDSTVAALLLKERGHDVVGVTMTLGRADEERSLAEAKSAAERLGIPLHVFDFAAEWKREILRYVAETYRGGETPNPCVRCNETVKFALLPRAAFALGCERFATGHYARVAEMDLDSSARARTVRVLGDPPEAARTVRVLEEPSEAARTVRLLRGVDHGKDQSYFLYRVQPEILAKTVFPLGGMTKDEVRAKAREFGLAVAEKGDSQDFCGGDPMAIVGAEPREGNIVTTDGKVLGRHQGFWNYTIGKRKGLGIGGGTPYYVVALRPETNEVVVGFKEATTVNAFSIRDIVTFGTVDPAEALTVKVRSAGEPKGPVYWAGGAVRCPEGLTGIAPGQSAVFFRGEEILGGGIIC